MGATILRGYSINSDIIFKVEAENSLISVKQASPLGLVANELITNALKYAFPAKRKGEIVLRYKINNEKQVDLTISDYGIGIPAGFNTQEADSLGLRLVHTIVENQLNGSVDVESNNGTKFTIKFNIEN